MTRLLAFFALFFALADHWTTYLCLRSPVAGWEVVEANPLAAWAFGRFGLVEGLLLDTAITMMALIILVRTPLIAPGWKHAAFALLIGTSSYAVANNLDAVGRMGLSVTGSAY